jgi:hypothetical protein
MSFHRVLETIRSHSDCIVLPPCGQPQSRNDLMIPKSVTDFYSICGGLQLFQSSDNRIDILSPLEVMPSNQIILGEETYNELLLDSELDRSMNWYTIGKYDNEYISIDFSKNLFRNGYCYDSYHETHGIPGENKIISKTLEKLIEMVYKNNGEYPYYWLRDDFICLGDAYLD